MLLIFGLLLSTTLIEHFSSSDVPALSPRCLLARFQRQQGTNVTLKHDGGWNYNPQVCVGNWGEERQEPGYSSGFHARELGFTKRYETEHNAAFKPHQPEVRGWARPERSLYV